MRKLILVALIATFCVSSYAQLAPKKGGLTGKVFATAQIGYAQTKSGNEKSTNFNVIPIVGTFVAPSTCVGIGAGYIGIKSESGSTTNANTNLTVVKPLARKYWNVAGGFFFFGQLSAPLIFGKEKQSELKISQIGLEMSGGIDYLIGKHFMCEFSYNLINFSTTTLKPKTGDKTTITDLSVAHIATAEAAYNTALGGSGTQLVTPFAFGFKFLF